MRWEIEYDPDVVKYDIPALPKKIKEEIKSAIEGKLMSDPIAFGKPLRYSLKGFRRLRVGDYRVVYKIIKDENTVLITVIKHRKDVYEDE